MNEVFVFLCPACRLEMDVSPPLRAQPPTCPACKSVMILDRLKEEDSDVRSGEKQ